MKKLTALTITAVLILVASVSWAEIPHLINYQGMLTTPVGSPVSDGQYNLTFKIYGSDSNHALMKDR